MQISTAAILHARTRNVDFRANLLAVPEDFSLEDVGYAKKKIVGSTRYFELAGQNGRRLVFSCGDHIISGISIRIGDLYRLCGKQPQYEFVDGNRDNYAFIGLVFPKNAVHTAVDIPYGAFLAEYEKYMLLRWEDAAEPAAYIPAKTQYCLRELPAAEKISTLLQQASGTAPQVMDSSADSVESFAAQAMLLAARQAPFSFCSDIPMANSLKEGGFTAATASNAAGILASLQKSSIPASPHISLDNTPRKNTSPPHHWDTPEDRRQKDTAKTAVSVPLLAVLGIMLTVLAVWLIMKH